MSPHAPQPAFPQPILRDELHGDVLPTMQGLSKREYAAIKIMAGFAADPSLANDCEDQIPNFAKFAVRWADALLAELNKGEQP